MDAMSPLATPPVTRLLDLYERNFHLVEQLVPELDLPFLTARSVVSGEPALYLITVDRGRYTASFRLTHEIDGRCEPDLWVRVYRDARVAEALQCARRPSWAATDEADPEAWRYLSAQWQRNLMMHKWLEYLIERGHGFAHAARPRRP
jgi:uncharacterized protein YqiB (DUF1249 family)